jgi:hypothetical protein
MRAYPFKRSLIWEKIIMLNTIIIVATSMGIVAFSGLGYLSMYDTANTTYASWLDVYIIFACGVGFGVSLLGLYDHLVFEYVDSKEDKE